MKRIKVTTRIRFEKKKSGERKTLFKMRERQLRNKHFLKQFLVSAKRVPKEFQAPKLPFEGC